MELKQRIEKAWEDRAFLQQPETTAAIREVVEKLDKGELRVAQPEEGKWLVNEWIKKAVIMYFPIQQMQTIEVGPFEFHDKIALKNNYKALRVRVVPHAIARYGSFLNKGVILMPSYVNIGAYVDEGTMVDTWATVGSCAQIGKNVHLSGGVGIGGPRPTWTPAPTLRGSLVRSWRLRGHRNLLATGRVSVLP
jgi:2,3,4,5-tetrahydropyridine-2-carboxylate N-succinyltransferase